MSIFEQLAEKNEEIKYYKACYTWSQKNNRIKTEIMDDTQDIILGIFCLIDEPSNGALKDIKKKLDRVYQYAIESKNNKQPRNN